MTQELTQLERTNEELAKLNENITEQDRKDYMDLTGVSRTLLSNYMNNKAYNLDRAIDMLVYFRAKVEEREKVLRS